jgi:excinuclease UvrABC ATPase subunit
VKLAKELSKRGTGGRSTLDEPTTGLHFEDTRLLDADEARRPGQHDRRHRHNLDVIKTADYSSTWARRVGRLRRIVAEGTRRLPGTRRRHRHFGASPP